MLRTLDDSWVKNEFKICSHCYSEGTSKGRVRYWKFSLLQISAEHNLQFKTTPSSFYRQWKVCPGIEWIRPSAAGHMTDSEGVKKEGDVANFKTERSVSTVGIWYWIVPCGSLLQTTGFSQQWWEAALIGILILLTAAIFASLWFQHVSYCTFLFLCLLMNSLLFTV